MSNAGVVPARGLALIRRIRTEDRYPGSRILLTDQSRDKVSACQFDIVAVGDYERCEDEDCLRSHNKKNEHVHRLKVGDWVLCRNRSWELTPEPDLYVCKQDSILGKFEQR
jgi:hypothetical protein